MSLGQAPKHQDLFQSSTAYCADRLEGGSIYGLLHREGHRLFPDEEFADLFTGVGRNSVSPQVVAVVMVLQRVEGLSDREAVERFTFDLRWKYAAGGLNFNYPGFVHTVLVDMRARLRRSARPNRVFDKVLEVAKEAGLIGRRRVLDSTALYDAVATQDTVTMIRSALRGVLKVAGRELEEPLRRVLKRDDDYRSPGKPSCAWEDPEAREALVDALAKDAQAVLLHLDGRTLSAELKQAAQLLATVVGQDLEEGPGGLFRIARRVAPDRVISTVDPQARHGHKTAARGFDGYKGHVSVDPDSELIVATVVTPGNQSDGSVGQQLLAPDLAQGEAPAPLSPEYATPALTQEPLSTGSEPKVASAVSKLEVYGDSSYGTADLVEWVEAQGGEVMMKVQAPSGKPGMYTKESFVIEMDKGQVTCPAGLVAKIRVGKDGAGLASFGAACAQCAQRDQCTNAKEGRVINLHPKEALLQRHRQRQKDPAWKRRYRAHRPKVERKQAHMMCRRHGGRRARVRGCERVGQDFAWLGAAINLKRLARLALRCDSGRWVC